MPSTRPLPHPPTLGHQASDSTTMSLIPLRKISSDTTDLYQGSRYESFMLKKAAALSMVGGIVFVGIAVIVMMVVINDKYQGVGISSSTADVTSWKHYVANLPTLVMVIVMAAVAAGVTAIDFSLQRIEPYRQLSRGGATANQSLLLDYVSIPKFFTWRSAIRHRHWIVATVSIASLLSMLLSPLASTMFVVKRTIASKNIKATFTQQIGFVNGWQDVLPAYSAANVASSIFLSNGSLPPYTTENWAFPSFNTIGSPAEGISSPTLTAKLPGIITSANCEDTTITYSPISDNTYHTWNAQVTGKKTGASWNQSLPGSGSTQFNASVSAFNNQADPRRQSFYYWIYTPVNSSTHPNMSATICSPTVALQTVQATFDANAKTVYNGSVTTIKGFNSSPLSIFNNTSPGFNGYYFDTSTFGPIVEQRRESTMFALVSIMYQVALNYNGGLPQAFADGVIFSQTNHIYQTYLSIMAQNTFYQLTQGSGSKFAVSSSATENLLFVSEPFAVALAVLLFLIAGMTLAALIFHWRTFDQVMLRVDPHTIAGQGIMLMESDVASVLSGPNLTRREMKDALRKHRWALRDGRICMDDDADADEDRVDMPKEENIVQSPGSAVHFLRTIKPQGSFIHPMSG